MIIVITFLAGRRGGLFAVSADRRRGNLCAIRQNRNLQIKFPSNYHTEYAQIGLAYSTATEMRGNQYFTGKILSAVATLEHTAGTPTSQVDRVIVDCNYGQNGRLEVYAQGAGFVSGHNLIINTIAIIED